MNIIFRGIPISVLLYASAAIAGTKDNHYSEIPERNVFGIRPPVILVKKTLPAPKATVRLQGITTILNRKQALIAILPALTPGTPHKESNYVLSEGESVGDIYVLEINANAGSVRISNSDELQTVMIAVVSDVKFASGLR